MRPFFVLITTPMRLPRIHVWHRIGDFLWYTIGLSVLVQALALDIIVDCCIALNLPACKWMDRHRRLLLAFFCLCCVTWAARQIAGPSGTGCVCVSPNVCAPESHGVFKLRHLSTLDLLLLILDACRTTASALAIVVGRTFVWFGGLGSFSQVVCVLVLSRLYGSLR